MVINNGDGSFSVGYSQMSEARDALMSANRAIERCLDDLGAALRRDIHDWEGEPKRQYEIAKRKWDQTMSEMNLMLVDMQGAVQDAEDAYRRSERYGQGLFSRN